MSKWKFLIAIAFASTTLVADDFVGDIIDSSLDVSFSYVEKNWILGLADGSCWRVMPLREKRAQSWAEWWNKEEPKEWQLGEEFFFDPYSWRGKYSVEVHRAKNSIANGFNYILINESNGQRAFAQFVPHGTSFIPKEEYALSVTENAESREATVLESYAFSDDILILNDGSIWKLHLNDKNLRSFAEWWNGVEIDQPDEMFVSTLKDWKISDRVELFSARFDDEEIQQKYGVSKREREVYLIENRTRGRMAFATMISLKDLLDTLKASADKMWHDGYNEGWREGHKQGRIVGKELGYKEGFLDGHHESQEENRPRK